MQHWPRPGSRDKSACAIRQRLQPVADGDPSSSTGAGQGAGLGQGRGRQLGAHASGGDIDQIRAVGAGACQVALTNTYYYLRVAASKNPGDKMAAPR